MDPLAGMILSYQELNNETVDELLEEPSPLEFMRYVAKNRPFVVRGAVKHWPARRKWNVEYLTRALDRKKVKVAVTPYGNADSAVVSPSDGVRYFVKPFEQHILFSDFVSQVQQRERSDSTDAVWYAQTQNDNLRGEYTDIFKDVDQDIAWARVALQESPDAINMWIGNSKSTTALHRDNYENIYCQILGRKHFVLIPPVEIACVNEQMLSPATYTKKNIGEEEVSEMELQITPDVVTDAIPCPIWDPDKPDKETNSYSGFCKPLRVDLNPGDLLYLPALWNHKVSQSVLEEGICCAVNYWYDMDFGGSLFASSNFFRELALEQNGRPSAPISNFTDP